MSLLKWSNYLEKNLFSDNDGFFELPYLSNSPDLMVRAVICMPISEHKINEQAIYTDNPYTTGVMRYRKIEEGLWLLATNISFKQNVISKALYDADEISDYYFLSFSVFDYKYPSDTGFNKFSTLTSTTCTFYKPATEVTTYFYKDTNGIFFNLVFNKKWVEKNITLGGKENVLKVHNFLNNETGFINWLDIVPNAVELSKEIWNNLEKEKEGVFETENLKIRIAKIIADFFNNSITDVRLIISEPLNNPDYANVAKAEKMILQNLNTPFIGVSNIAKSVNISPTKLKAIFKSIFGFSMLQYHKEKNMLLAKQLIKNSATQIKNIASITGYESPSKFSATFKKRFGILPSEMRSNKKCLNWLFICLIGIG